MADATAKSIVTSVTLRNASIMYQPPQFVATEVYKQIDVNDPKAKITKYLSSDFFRKEGNLQRGEGGRAKRGGFKTTTVPWDCIEYAFASEVTDEKRRNSKKQGGQPLDPDIKAVQLCRWKMLMNKEYLTAQNIITSKWADGNIGGEDVEGKWASSATANTFKADIKNALKVMREKGIVSGPDFEIRLLMDDLTFDEVTEIAEIKDQIKYTSNRNVTPEILAYQLKVDKVIVPSSVYNSAKETKAGTEFTASRFWEINADKGMAFLYAYPKNQLALEMMCAGLLVRDKFDEEEGGGHERLMKWREPAEHQDVYELAENQDEIQVCADAGYLWCDTISS